MAHGPAGAPHRSRPPDAPHRAPPATPSGAPAAPPAVGNARGLWWLLLVVVVLIVHGSLYPWHFAAPPSLGDALARTLGAGPLWTGRGDVLGNIALFLPLGALLRPLLRQVQVRGPWLWGVAAAAVLAWGVQFVQIWVPGRSPSWSDAVWNMVGLAAGVALARLAADLSARFDIGAGRAWSPASVMVVLWLGLQWWPFVPTLDWQHMKDALRPLLLQPRLSPHSLAEAALSTLVLAQGLRGVRRRGMVLGLLLALAWAGKLFIAEQALSASAVAGGLLAWALAPALWRLDESTALGSTAIVAWLWFTADALRPYEWADAPGAFSWLPFVALLEGNLMSNLLSLLWNAFWIGAVMAAAVAMRARVAPLAVALALWVLLLEGAQTWLAGRVADSTPALLPLGWWLLARAFAPPTPRPRPRRRSR